MRHVRFTWERGFGMWWALRILAISLGLGSATHTLADERIWLKGFEINDKPVRLIFDTGSSYNFLSPEALKGLGLKFIPSATNDLPPWVWAGDTEVCTMSFKGFRGETTFLVLDVPRYAGADFEGCIGWYSMSRGILKIDGISRGITLLSQLPRETHKWMRLSVNTNFGTLDLRIPHGTNPEGILCVDTGLQGGVSLPKEAWLKWRGAHTNSSVTFDTGFFVADGFEVLTEAWADRITFGPVVLTDVPVNTEGPKKASVWGTNYEGTIGLAALRRMEFIVDGSNSVVYLTPKKTRAPSYTHNRLGAVFVPTGTHTNQAVAWVTGGSPAYEAGVRDGDILLQVEQIACTSWSGKWINQFKRPAGTRLKLTLERDGKTFEATATLRDILCPTR